MQQYCATISFWHLPEVLVPTLKVGSGPKSTFFLRNCVIVFVPEGHVGPKLVRPAGGLVSAQEEVDEGTGDRGVRDCVAAANAHMCTGPRGTGLAHNTRRAQLAMHSGAAGAQPAAVEK